MIFKDGVDPDSARPELKPLMDAADIVFRRHGVEAVVTSLDDGAHMEDSLHYKGLAADLRIWHVLERIVDEIRTEIRNLGADPKDYDILLEMNRNGHIHGEYDPD